MPILYLFVAVSSHIYWRLFGYSLSFLRWFFETSSDFLGTFLRFRLLFLHCFFDIMVIK